MNGGNDKKQQQQRKMARQNRIEPYTKILVVIGVLFTVARILSRESTLLKSIALHNEIMDQPSVHNVNDEHSSSSPSSYRLEFLHIPKNAGTMIEAIALEKNITWGKIRNFLFICFICYIDQSTHRLIRMLLPIIFYTLPIYKYTSILEYPINTQN